MLVPKKYFYPVIIIFCVVIINKNVYAENYSSGYVKLQRLISLLNSDPNEALRLGFEILELPEKDAEDSTRAFALVEIGFILNKQGLPAQALSFSLQGLKMLTDIGLRHICGFLIVDIGNIYFHQKLYESASEKYYSAKEIFESQKYPGGVYTCFNNLALIAKEQKKYHEAKTLFHKALNLALEEIRISYLEAHSYSYLGDLFQSQGLQDSAIYYYNKALSIEIKEKNDNLIGLNHQKVSDILLQKGKTDEAIEKLLLAEEDFSENYNVYYLLKLYLKISDIHFKKGAYNKAINYLNLAYSLAEKDSILSEQITILEKLNSIYDKVRDFGKYDSNRETINKLLKKRYDEDVKAIIQKIDTQNLIDDYNERIKINELNLENTRLARNIAILVAVLFFVTLWLLFVHYRAKKKFHNLLLENLERQHTKELEIEVLKKEQAHRELVTLATQIQSQNDFLFNIKKQLKNQQEETSQNPEKDIKTLLRTINDAIFKGADWDKFREQFIKVHPSFFDKLTSITPDLSANELKILAYHKMNLETKDIASLTALSVRSIQTIRYRLRKKLNIPKEASFQEFINQI